MRFFSAGRLFFISLGIVAFQLPAQAAPIDLPDIPRCTELIPGAIAVDSTPVTLGLRVALDGVGVNEAQGLVSAALATYVPLGVEFLVSYEQAGFSSTDGLELLAETKNFYGGVRPAGAHLVYVLTAKDLSDATLGTALAGQADCIGGVVYEDSAFAVGEFDPEVGAQTMAHELGHLFGGQHHYANCGESLLQGGDNFCTLMFNDVGFAALVFSSLNGAVARGHAQLAASTASSVTAPGGEPTAAAHAEAPSASSSNGGSLGWLSFWLAAAAFARRRSTLILE